MPCLSYFFKLLGDYLNFEHVKHGFFGRDISLRFISPGITFLSFMGQKL